MQNSGKRLGCLDAAGLTLGMSTSAYPLIFCCRSRVIFYWRSGITAGVQTKLLCSIVLAGGDQIDEGLEGLDDPIKSASDPGEGPIWMHDCLGKWFRLKPLKRMIARTIWKVSTNQTNDWPTNQTNQPIKPTINRSRPTNQVIKNNGLTKPSNFGKNPNQSRSNWLNDYDHRQYRRWYQIRSGVAQRFGLGARDLKPAKGQAPNAEALKIQLVDIGR